MAALPGSFDATQYDTDTPQSGGDFPDLPLGVYRFDTEVAEVGVTKDAKGNNVKMTFSVLEPNEFAGRKIWHTWTIKHEDPSNKGLVYGGPMFARYCRAIGIAGVQDTDEVLFKSFTAKAGMDKGSKEKNADGTPVYAPKPEIKELYYADSDDIPALGVLQPPTGKPIPANDNRASANDNKPAAAETVKKKTPWAK